MRAPWLLVVSLTVCASSAYGQGLARPGRLNRPMGVPSASRPASTPPGKASEGVLVEMTSNLGRGVVAELTQDYKEAVKLLTRATEEEHGDAQKLVLAYRFRGLAYKNLGRRDEALNDFLEVIRIQPQLDLGYYDAGVIYNLTNRYQEAVDAMTRAIDLRQDDRGLGRRRGERGNAYFHLGQFKRAQDDFVAAVRLAPHDADALNNAAWFRATCPDASFRNGKEAVEL